MEGEKEGGKERDKEINLQHHFRFCVAIGSSKSVCCRYTCQTVVTAWAEVLARRQTN